MGVRSGRPSVSALALVSIFALKSAAAAEPFTAAQPVTAAEPLTYGVDVGVAETDNVTLAPTNKVSQTMAVADVDFDVNRRSRLLDVDAKGNFSDINYLQGAYGNQLIGRFDGVAHVALIPERLTWALSDDFGQAALDPFAPSTPTNLENVNYVSTGPDLNLRLGPTSFFNASVRFARAQYQTSPFNSDRILGNLAWGRLLSAQSSVSLNGNVERVLFDNTALNSDFTHTSGFGRYEVHGARTEFSADLGATTISQGGASTTGGPVTIGQGGTLTTGGSQGGGSTTGGLAKIELARKLSTAAKLTLSIGHDLTDASSSFSNLQGGAIGVVGTAPAALTSNTYTTNYASAGWQYQRNRTTLAVSGRWERDTYGGESLLDYTRSGAEFRVERKLTRALSAEIFGRYYKTNYPHFIVSPASGSADFDDELIAGVLTWRHGRGLEVKLKCEHDARVAMGINGYRENRAVLTVGYRPYSVAASYPADQSNYPTSRSYPTNK
jgi:hypothetical protein